MPVNTVSLDGGTIFSGGVSIVTAGDSAVSAYGPIVGRDVAVVAITVAANDSTNTAFAVTGAAVGDGVIVHPPSAISADLIWNAFVSSAGNVTLQFANSTITAVAQTAQTWGFSLIRRSIVSRGGPVNVT